MMMLAAASRFGLARETVRKRYCGTQRRLVVSGASRCGGPFTGFIDLILCDEREHPKKQPHTAQSSL